MNNVSGNKIAFGELMAQRNINRCKRSRYCRLVGYVIDSINVNHIYAHDFQWKSVFILLGNERRKDRVVQAMSETM